MISYYKCTTFYNNIVFSEYTFPTLKHKFTYEIQFTFTFLIIYFIKSSTYERIMV